MRRIAVEEIDRALRIIGDERVGADETVHEARKRLKRIRGLIRLVRPEFPPYSRENARFRDIAGRMSLVRDAGAFLETCDALEQRFGDSLDGDPIGSLRASLESRRDRLLDSIGIREIFSAVRADLEEARGEISDWNLEKKGFEAIAGGYAKVYGRARNGMRAALEDPTIENFHEWRKRVKYHRYHLRLLRELWPTVMGPWRDSAKLLSDRLGDDHDLAVLRGELTGNSDRYDRRAVSVILGLIDNRRTELQAWTKPTAMRLFAEKPKRAVDRLRGIWDAWVVEHQLEAALPKESAAVS